MCSSLYFVFLDLSQNPSQDGFFFKKIDPRQSKSAVNNKTIEHAEKIYKICIIHNMERSPENFETNLNDKGVIPETPHKSTAPENNIPEMIEGDETAQAMYEETIAELNTSFPEELSEGSLSLANTDSPKTAQPQENSNFSKTVRNTVAAISLAFASLGFAGSADSAENPIPDQPAKTATKEASPVKRSAELPVKELESRVKTHVKELGMFSKIDLVKDIKEHADDIRGVIASGEYDGVKTQELLASSGKNLKPILHMYMTKLAELKQSDTTSYQAVVTKLEGFVTKVETKSLSELSREFN